MTLRLTSLVLTLTGLAAFLLVPTHVQSAQAATSNPALSETAVVLQKSPVVLDQRTQSYVQQRDGATATVWVFFTDKGLNSKSAFDQAASSVTFTERAAVRRAKVNLDRPVFADLPVAQTYVQGVEAAGAKVRRVSRWLNAASFDIPTANLATVANLPFVQRIAPVVKFKKDYEATEVTTEAAPLKSPSSGALNYGLSFNQLNQISVPAAHDKGYSGQGVTLAIFDTGFRKSHEAFANHYADGRVLAEHDFIFNDGNTANEAGDVSNQWDHGTYIWSVSGGYKDGTIYGPAYKANFILCKTEDVRSETPVEEDNWVAALEWVDSIGADVITSSLGYSDWYTYADMDGNTATISIAASTAAGLGIVVCNSMGNAGPGAGSLSAPADAFDILSVGAVDANGNIAGFSSRGPTYDGRMKPEVCARGVSTFCATSSSNTGYGTASGTSLSTPLVAGATCLAIEAHPTYTPLMIRQSLMESGSRASTPDNDYGWGIINVNAAFTWGANFTVSPTIGPAPLAVQFTENSPIPSTSRMWYFGDGDSSNATDPLHVYAHGGLYTAELVTQNAYGQSSVQKPDLVAAIADTLRFVPDSAYAGHQVITSVTLTNSQPLASLIIPFKLSQSPLKVTLDSVTRGSRTAYFDDLLYLNYNSVTGRFGVKLTTDATGSSYPLATGAGEVLRIYSTIDPYALGSRAGIVDTATFTGYSLQVQSAKLSYTPVYYPGTVTSRAVKRGDLTLNFFIDLSDLSQLISWLTLAAPPPPTIQCADYNADLIVDVSDLSAMVEYLTNNGAPPPNP